MINLLNFPHNLEEMMNEEKDGTIKQQLIIKRQQDEKEDQKKDNPSIHAKKLEKPNDN